MARCSRPSADVILDAAGRTANDWRSLAVLWHIYFGALAMMIVRRRQLSSRVVAYALALPVASVSAMAWSTGNPFNGSVFAGLGLGLAAIARRLPTGAPRIGGYAAVAAGVSLAAFGWAYPHFLEASHWTMCLVAAPLGLAGLAYGAIGIVGLGVRLDLGLAAGAVVLLLGQLTQIVVHRRERRLGDAVPLTDG